MPLMIFNVYNWIVSGGRCFKNMSMGFPETYHIIFMAINIAFFFTIFDLLFIKQTFERTIAAFIFCFLNIFLSFIVGMGFFAIDFFSYDSDGVIISNMVSDYNFLGYIFIGLAYISFIMLLYCFYLFYEKPWSKTRKVEGNPYA